MGETAESAAVPWRSTTVQVILASTLLAPLGVPLISPALPVIRDAFGVTDTQASLLISVYFLTGIVLSPFIGILADNVGRRRVLIPSLFVFSLLGGSVSLASNFQTVLAIRLLQGTAAAGIFITTVTIIGDVFEGVQRNAVLGVNVAVLSAGAAVYPIVGGTLATFGWEAVFLAYLAGLPVALFALRVLEEPPVVQETRNLAYLRGAVGALAGTEPVVLYGATFLTETILFGTILTALPFLLASVYDLGPVLIGLTLTVTEVAAIVVASQNGRLAKRVSDYTLIVAGFACYGVALVGTWLAPSPAFVAASVLVFGAGLGLSMPSVDAALTRFVPSQFRAGALSVRNSVTFLGRATGPVLFASVAATTGYRTLLLAAAVVALAGGAVAALLTGVGSMGQEGQ